MRKTLVIRIPVELYERLLSVKEKKGLSINSLVTQVLWELSEDKKETAVRA